MLTSSSNERCTQHEYHELLACSAKELRWLCYTLTGSEELSEKSLAIMLEQTRKGAGEVFREWMLRWARRMMIKFCVATVQPEASIARQSVYVSPAIISDSIRTDPLETVLSRPLEFLQQELLRLDALLRFVFVLRALEGYSRHDTALLLNLDDRTCDWVYSSAIEAMRLKARIVEL